MGGNSFTPARSERDAFPTPRQCTESTHKAHERLGLRQCTELLNLLPHRGQLLAQVCRLALHLCHHCRRRLVHKLLVGQARLQGTKERQRGRRRLVDQTMQHDAQRAPRRQRSGRRRAVSRTDGGLHEHAMLKFSSNRTLCAWKKQKAHLQPRQLLLQLALLLLQPLNLLVCK